MPSCGKLALVATVALAFAGAARAQAPAPPTQAPAAQPQPVSSAILRARVAPGLIPYTDDVLFGDVWERPQLAKRDRSLVVISTLIATGKAGQLRNHLDIGLTNGLTPVETSGLVTHMAFYAGWPAAISALEVYDTVYRARKIDPASLRLTAPPLPPAAGQARVETATRGVAALAPKFAQLSDDVILGDLWRRPDLSVRDRSLATIAAVAAMGDDDLLEPHLRRGLAAGLTREQLVEALTHLGFYAGFPKATKALNVLARIRG